MRLGNYEVTNDSLQWILREYYEGEDKDGNKKEMLTDGKYFASLKKLLERMQDQTMKKLFNTFNKEEHLELMLDAIEAEIFKEGGKNEE
jgi:uncharacterized membrane-anchored protein